MFARDGYLNAKISDIAAAAGRSVASFYNYYDTKADLLIALAEEFHAEASQLAALPYRAGLSGEEALREAVAGFWRTYAKRRGELIGIFQAAMVEGRFRDRWLELRGEAITRIATAVRKAQADGYCPGVDPVMTASALSAIGPRRFICRRTVRASSKAAGPMRKMRSRRRASSSRPEARRYISSMRIWA